jgi:hypothetical protein
MEWDIQLAALEWRNGRQTFVCFGYSGLSQVAKGLHLTVNRSHLSSRLIHQKGSQ